MGHKIALVSDIHFGVKSNSETYLKIMKDFFCKTLSSVITTRKVTDVRILGDVFDCRNNINVRTLNTVIDIFDWYEEKLPDIKFKILLGNHDIYFKNRIDVNSIRVLSRHKNVEIIDSITEEVINGKSIITYPWLVDDSEIAALFESHCNGTKKWDLCLGHFEIAGFEMTKGNVDENGHQKGKFKNFGRVFTGHYHIRNTIGHISYLGCPFEINWNDYGDDKGIHIYDLEQNKTEFIKNEDSPKHIRVKVSEIIDGDAAFMKKLDGNSIKVIIDKKYDDTDMMKAQSKIESLQLIKLDTENNHVDEDIEADDVDITNLGNAMIFLQDFISSIELEEGLDSKEVLEYIADIHSKVETEND